MVLNIEQNVSNKERIKQQNKYVHLMNNNEKALIVRWNQNVFQILLKKIYYLKFYFLIYLPKMKEIIFV